ncbi:flagellar biosynthesis anti-sigma factor FlgM [Halothermothrix orenii]|uniref:Negative regulator of flagellin synthesis n=1 Tax=Halothermothrix orenii (strain H 168 / OCM 544 / DSM 9562) TaxID=373903 RepID=B8CYU6_HALOH|nr:flagellar biosynthesis anti-sigma factor FlgM [Halothermothrix orenii]ACL70465.1 Anti-sigma-28 factor FlgM family protein [Halothermothrix orenii H 168]
MRVNETQGQKISQLYIEKKKEVNKKNKMARKDKITISNKGIKVSEIKQELARIPDVRKRKIESLKRQIQEGNYRVPAREIARKLTENI